MSKPNILITGAAGFIGMHACEKFHLAGYHVEAFDNFNDYYAVDLKRHRFKYLKDYFENISVAPYPPNPDSSRHSCFNIGNHQPRQVIDLVAMIKKNLGKKATINCKSNQQSDVYTTSGDTSALRSVCDFSANTSFEWGVEKFVKWFLEVGQSY
jgi:nucleoside-diphosphate-sugar epimerase